MSIKFISEFVFDIYVKKSLIKDINFSAKSDIEKYLKKIFKVLSSKYNLSIEGFYNITIYVDKFYGVVLHMEKQELDYYEYYKNQVDMRLVTLDTEFMYEVDDVPIDILNKVDVYVKNNTIYLIIKKELSNLEMMKLIENSKLVYK